MPSKDYDWTVQSALYQMRWEPTERRASAASYLTGQIMTGSEQQTRDIAYSLLSIVTGQEAQHEN